MEHHKLTLNIYQNTIDHYRAKYPDRLGAKLSDDDLLDEIERVLQDEVTAAVIDAILYYEVNNDTEEE